MTLPSAEMRAPSWRLRLKPPRCNLLSRGFSVASSSNEYEASPKVPAASITGPCDAEPISTTPTALCISTVEVTSRSRVNRFQR